MAKQNDLKKQLENSIKLAHLELDGDEKKALISDLGKILNFVSIVEKFRDNRGGEDFPQLKKRNYLREDSSRPFGNTEGLLGQVPFKKEKLIKVKKI